mmetsp:Transcript_20817/g.41522  ORF Transcript_20817/g.41522 Transcript_20817/m.41522 type:complete len:295 (-) Transcript_20817:326-1210(-)
MPPALCFLHQRQPPLPLINQRQQPSLGGATETGPHFQNGGNSRPQRGPTALRLPRPRTRRHRPPCLLPPFLFAFFSLLYFLCLTPRHDNVRQGIVPPEDLKGVAKESPSRRRPSLKGKVAQQVLVLPPLLPPFLLFFPLPCTRGREQNFRLGRFASEERFCPSSLQRQQLRVITRQTCQAVGRKFHHGRQEAEPPPRTNRTLDVTGESEGGGLVARLRLRLGGCGGETNAFHHSLIPLQCQRRERESLHGLSERWCCVGILQGPRHAAPSVCVEGQGRWSPHSDLAGTPMQSEI